MQAISQTPDADLVMVYIEQPDGSEHQFLLTDARQATDPTNPNTISDGQDQSKITRYQKYVQTAYQAANNAVQRIIDAVGTGKNGTVSSFYGAHGYNATILNMSAILYAAGPDIGHGSLTQVRNIDVTPTIDKLLGVEPAPTVQGQALNLN